MEYCLSEPDGSATMWTATADTDLDGDGRLESVRESLRVGLEITTSIARCVGPAIIEVEVAVPSII